ncbi:MAG: Omp28-related outer membrane protein [Moraxellaceae bacterium]
MKKISVYLGFILLLVIISSCDKVTNPYPPTSGGNGELDWSLYPDGDSAHYAQNKWPTFIANTNSLRNVLIEDFTGHTCNSCPAAATLAHTLETNNPARVFTATIHTGPTGMGPLQAVQLPDYPTNWTNPQGLEIGKYFGSIPGSAFQGNPRGTINRTNNGGQLTLHPSGWTSKVNSIIAANDLKVNVQAHSNYFASTRGYFLHTELALLDASLVANQLGMVVYLIEDSIIGDQKMSDNSHNPTYVHRDVMRSCIDGKAFGRTISTSNLSTNGNYYLNYSYKLPASYDPTNTHVLIYVYDKTTMEIYQVIEHEIIE